MRITTLDEIREQTKPRVVELPGFCEGTSVNVKLRIIDLTPRLMKLRIGNPLLAEAQKMAKDGMSQSEIAVRLDNSLMLEEMLPLLDEVAKEALVVPTYVDIISIYPLTLAQKLKIFEYATGLDDLRSFRSE